MSWDSLYVYDYIDQLPFLWGELFWWRTVVWGVISVILIGLFWKKRTAPVSIHEAETLDERVLEVVYDEEALMHRFMELEENILTMKHDERYGTYQSLLREYILWVYMIDLTSATYADVQKSDLNQEVKWLLEETYYFPYRDEIYGENVSMSTYIQKAKRIIFD